MKNFSSILNIILLIAVAILFYLHFSTPKTEVAKVSKDATVEVNTIEDSLTQFMELDSNISAKPIKIAYVNNDSLTVHLDMLRDVEARIQAKEKMLQAKIQGKQNSYDRQYKKKVEDYKTAEKKLMLALPTLTDAQAEVEKGKLMGLQESIMKLEQTAQQTLYQLNEDQKRDFLIMKSKEMSDYYVKLQNFCQSFAKALGFDFIMIYQEGGAFLYSNPDYDVSNYVIDAINKEYSQNKSLSTTTK
ncbi:OmpH family outer membrane protein [Flavobacteriales bacterium]|nr:OmpH family outer membrane protein [Flavobacteriales bacterium]